MVNVNNRKFITQSPHMQVLFTTTMQPKTLQREAFIASLKAGDPGGASILRFHLAVDPAHQHRNDVALLSVTERPMRRDVMPL